MFSSNYCLFPEETYEVLPCDDCGPRTYKISISDFSFADCVSESRLLETKVVAPTVFVSFLTVLSVEMMFRHLSRGQVIKGRWSYLFYSTAIVRFFVALFSGMAASLLYDWYGTNLLFFFIHLNLLQVLQIDVLLWFIIRTCIANKSAVWNIAMIMKDDTPASSIETKDFDYHSIT